MDSFREIVGKCNNLSLDTIKNAAKKALPPEYQHCPWQFTKRGGSDVDNTIYTHEWQLDAYLASYVDWHRGKLVRAFKLLNEAMPRRINVIDWGCGQGLGTLFLIDHIKQHHLSCFINEVILIEPSKIALERAEFLIRLADGEIKIRTINKMIDDVTTEELKFMKLLPVYQMFSNILDIKGIDLKHLANILYANESCFNTLICVSPFYASGNARIDSFFNYFQRPLALEKRAYESDKLNLGYTYYIRIIKLIPNATQQIIKYNFYPAAQFRAAYELSSVRDKNTFPNRLTYFDVYAPFDLGASVSDDPHPILAVLNNIITRGLPTCPSPFVERQFCVANDFIVETSGNGIIKFDVTEQGRASCDLALEHRKTLTFGDCVSQNEVAYAPLAVARIQKLLVEVLMSGKLDLQKPEWNVLVEENDVPCAALAFEDFKQMFNMLASMSVEYETLRLPEIKLTVISNEKYNSSVLHLNESRVEQPTAEIKNVEYDLVIHYSTGVKNKEYDFSTYKAKNNCYFAVYSADEDNLKAERYIYTTDRITYKPFVTKDTRGLYMENDEQVGKLTYFLNLLFRKEKFRKGQLPILTRALENLSVIGLLPTGGGKSLTYQLAALLQPGITIVIDPLVSLMKDQYDGLLSSGIDSCTFINATVTNKGEREELMEQSKVQFLFISPERLCVMRFRNRLKNMQELHVYFAYGVIDEVHCVSEWGHDFRFSYLHLGRNLCGYVLPKRKNGADCKLPLLGLTATASFDVLADVERELWGNEGAPMDAIVRYENTNRLELQYHVVPIDGDACYNKWDVYREKNDCLSGIVRKGFEYLNKLQEPENISRIKRRFIERENIIEEKVLSEINQADLRVDINERWFEERPNKVAAIVFCPHRRGSIGVNDTPSNIGIASSLGAAFGNRFISRYVGGNVLTEQEKFLAGETSIMVATKAFGMGIDKPNVRFTYNMSLPGSLEAFVQEAGRAGRDGKMALATILYCRQQFIEQNPRTRFMENIPVDYGIHKFFYDNNFIGEEFEKMIMYYLLAMSITDVGDEEILDSKSVHHKQVSGFMEELLSRNIGESLVSYISYSQEINQGIVSRINAWLRKRHYPILVFKDSKNIGEGEMEFVATIEKAIYRMCCVGIIDDYTRDYQNQQFRIVTKRKTDEEYFYHLKLFLMRYYTDERSDMEMRKAFTYRGENAMQKCLGYITGFVYEKIAKKCEQAIRDMETFCEQAVSSKVDWIRTNEDLKDFIYYYFNSKFAREDYVTENGMPYSLTIDSDHGKRSSYDLLFKYMNVVDDDVIGASGSPKDNIRHLQGAVRLIRRALTDSNPALDFLNVFCLMYLNVQDNRTLQLDLRDSFVNGYKEFKLRAKSYEEFYDNMAMFVQALKDKGAVTEDRLPELEEWQQISELECQLDWLDGFKKQYIAS